MIDASERSRRAQQFGLMVAERCVRVSFYVAIYRQVRPDRVQHLLSAIHRGFAQSRTATPGRQTSRVFQRLNEPETLLSLAEWDSQEASEAYRDSPAFSDTTNDIGPPPTLDYLRRRYLFERMNERAAVVACATIRAPVHQEATVFEYVMGSGQRTMVEHPGLVSREVYQQVQTDPRQSGFLVVHGWRALSDLDRFRAADASEFEARLKEWGATATRFTGQIALEYSSADHARQS